MVLFFISEWVCQSIAVDMLSFLWCIFLREKILYLLNKFLPQTSCTSYHRSLQDACLICLGKQEIKHWVFFYGSLLFRKAVVIHIMSRQGLETCQTVTSIFFLMSVVLRYLFVLRDVIIWAGHHICGQNRYAFSWNFSFCSFHTWLACIFFMFQVLYCFVT